MNLAFTEEIKNIGDEMEISMYQRFSLNEASLFLHCTNQNVLDLAKQHKINYIQITATQIEFFGYQLLQYLLKQTTDFQLSESTNSQPTKKTKPKPTFKDDIDRIIRADELQEITDPSRTTIWRLENKGQFPRRLALSANSVG